MSAQENRIDFISLLKTYEFKLRFLTQAIVATGSCEKCSSSQATAQIQILCMAKLAIV